MKEVISMNIKNKIEEIITTIIVVLVIGVLFCPLNPCNIPRQIQKSIDNLDKTYKLADKNYPMMR
jgi:hypothetical protein